MVSSLEISDRANLRLRIAAASAACGGEANALKRKQGNV